MLRRAKEAGVSALMAVGGSPKLNEAALAACEIAKTSRDDMPECYPACGYDRDHAVSENLPVIADKLTAWGEIGLDYYYNSETRDIQRSFFAKQLEEARRRDLPVIIHTREADDDTLSILREIPSRGVIHCFTGNPKFCRMLLDLGFYISISGIVTFRLADNVRESAVIIPDDRLLIETDSPFLAPVPMRGKPNEPAFITHTSAFMAKLRNTTTTELAELTAVNARLCFNL